MLKILNKASIFMIFIIYFEGNIIANKYVQVDTLKNTEENQAIQKEKRFNPGDFIFEHIKDNHSWHLFTHKEHPISIPLPVILYSKTKGIDIFWSNKLDYGKIYNGFKIALEGEYKDKIIEVNDKGEFIDHPFDISITKDVAAIMFSFALMLLVFISVARSYEKRKDQAPKGIQSLLEPVILFIRDDIAKASIGDKHYESFTPYLLTIFFFILFNNLMGLIPIFPGGANITGNITVTLVLALFTFIITTFNGKKTYWKHIFNPEGVPWWLKLPIPLIPFIEFIGLFIKPFVLMVRLFANISAGHIIVLGFFSLIFIFGNISPGLGYAVSPVSIAFTIFMSFLELLVAFIQAYVFTILSAIYFGMAVEEHHEH